jgi:hypothetical protein
VLAEFTLVTRGERLDAVVRACTGGAGEASADHDRAAKAA